jgi:carboxymethylenebutenolidase
MPRTSTLTLTAADGHRLGAFLAEPDEAPRGRLVVIQEVFGVNNHIRSVCEQFASLGYATIAPALYDRIEQGIELGYGDDDLARGRELRTSLGWDSPVQDVAAALAHYADRGPVGTIGYCWGGSVSWLAATRLGPACSVCYYGGQIVQFKDERPTCPVQMHFGENDHIITQDDVAAIRAAQPDVEMHLYPGVGHGFNCTERPDYHPESAKTALDRTLAFFEKHLV